MVQKIPLAGLNEWHRDTSIGPRYRGASTQSGQYVQISVSRVEEYSYAWSIVAPGILNHTEYAATVEEAQYAADRYLEERFELPVSIEDKLAAAEKRIAELETSNNVKFLPFSIGNRVYVNYPNIPRGPYRVDAITLSDGSDVYTLDNGRKFFADSLEPA